MGAAFQRIVIVMLENSTRANVLANPYMNALRQKGVFLANAHGVTHSSQPNYILSIGGDTFGIVDDQPGYARWLYERGPEMPMVTSIVDLLEARGLTWKAYAENLTEADKPLTPTHPPIEPRPAKGTFPFARKHVPFLSYPSITSNAARLANVVEAAQFEADLAAGTLPSFSWFTPNLVNDGHSLAGVEERFDPHDANRHVNIDNIAAFLHRFFLGDDPLARFPPETLIVVTFDEAYPYSDPYQIYTLLIGDMLQADTVRFEPYNHYSTLRSIEENWGLGSLGRNDAAARPWWFLAGV